MIQKIPILYLIGHVHGDNDLKLGCLGDSCNPAKCSAVENLACDFPEENWDTKDLVEQLPCKQCTQSSKPQCSSSSISDLYTLSQFHAIYCNDDFMVAWSMGTPVHETGLDYIERPPGGGSGGGYAEECVVRSTGNQLQIYKFPLEPVKATLDDDKFIFDPQGEDITIAGAVGMAKNGVPIYPYMNNRGESVWDSCEADFCNAHAGKGEDYHYHGNPFGSRCVYSEDDYTTSHPPQIGMSVDGYPIHGHYFHEGSEDGLTDNLDSCSGHDHDSYGYHYHAENVQIGGDDNWTEYRLGPSNCWAGDISKIPNFWQSGREGEQIEYDLSKTNPKFCPFVRNDIEEIKPCCGSDKFYTTPDIRLNTESPDICASQNGCATQSKHSCPSGTEEGSTKLPSEEGSRLPYKLSTLSIYAAILVILIQ